MKFHFVNKLSVFQGVKRPSEYNQTQHNTDDGNSNMKTNASLRSHPNDRRSDFRYDTEYNSSKFVLITYSSICCTSSFTM
jgi:hypothetical protein